MRPAKPTPSLGSALRAAAVDFYFHSIRLVPANIAWGAVLFVLLAIGAWVSPSLALVAAPLLCLPLVGVARLAAEVARGEDVVLSDARVAMRSLAMPALVAGLASTAAAVILATNVVAGIAIGGPVGWAFAVFASWGIVALWIVSLCFWPLLADPARTADPLPARARLAVLVPLAEPVRFGSLGVAIGLITIASLIAFPALLSISVAFELLVAARVVLPSADALEARLIEAAARRTAGSVGPG